MSISGLNKTIEALAEVRQGKLVELAARHQMSIKLFVDAVVSSQNVLKGYRTPVTRGLCRQLAHVGPGGGGYDKAIVRILDQYNSVTHALADPLNWLGILEVHGFQYADPHESVGCLQSLTSYIKASASVLSGVMKLYPSSSDAVLALKEIEGLTGFDPANPSMASNAKMAEGAIHQIARGLGFDCKRGKGNPPAPITSSGVFILAMKIFCDVTIEDNRHVVLTDSFSREMMSDALGEVIKPLHGAYSMGLSDQKMDEIYKHQGALVLRNLCQHLVRGDVQFAEVDQVLATDALLKNRDLLRGAMDVWRSAGRPDSLKAFVDLGGSLQSWEAHLLEKELIKRRFRERAAQEQLARERERLGKGNKRTQRGYKPTSPQAFNFDELERQLVVHQSFLQYGEAQIQALIVRGFLQKGDRLPVDLIDIEPIDSKKLWRACRQAFDSRRQMDKLIDELVRARVIVREGKRLRIKTPSTRYPQACVQVQAIKTLITKAHATSL